jgi:hypothetical protein
MHTKYTCFSNQFLPYLVLFIGCDHLAAEVASMGVGQAGQAAQLCHHAQDHHWDHLLSHF